MAASTATSPATVATPRALPLPIIRSPTNTSSMPNAQSADQRPLLERGVLAVEAGTAVPLPLHRLETPDRVEGAAAEVRLLGPPHLQAVQKPRRRRRCGLDTIGAHTFTGGREGRLTQVGDGVIIGQ